jgi:hypothetical protein
MSTIVKVVLMYHYHKHVNPIMPTYLDLQKPVCLCDLEEEWPMCEILIGESEGSKPLERSRRIQVNNNKIDLRQYDVIWTVLIWLMTGTI